MNELRVKYHRDDFEPWMKWTLLDKTTGAVVRQDRSDGVPPENISYGWVPRIKCNDCPGKQYTAAPDNAADNFEVHLKNRLHQQRVDQRVK
jgi:SWI/SNF-related matrix-associated actin-dependent regulator of chromatin subfamily B protein 1